MGKAAENERIKLHATFWNNLAVAIGVAAFVVPYVAIVYGGQFDGMTITESLAYPQFWRIIGASAAVLILVAGMRLFVSGLLSHIED